MPCSITAVGVAAGVPQQRVEVRDVHERQVVAVGHRMPGVRDPALRRVVLDVDRRELGGRSQRAASSRSRGRCSTTTSNGSSRSAAGVTSADGPASRRSAPGRGRPARDPGSDRHEVVVAALDERGRPGAVHVPEQDPHAATACGGQAARTAASHVVHAQRRPRHGWPGTGQTRGPAARRTARPMWSSTCGTRQGRQRTAGHRRREQRDDRGADRRGEVGRPGVADHDRVGARQHGGQLGERRAPAQVDPGVAGDDRGEHALGRRAR